LPVCQIAGVGRTGTRTIAKEARENKIAERKKRENIAKERILKFANEKIGRYLTTYLKLSIN